MDFYNNDDAIGYSYLRYITGNVSVKIVKVNGICKYQSELMVAYR